MQINPRVVVCIGMYVSVCVVYQFLALSSDALISAGMILMNEHFSFFEELGVQKGKLHCSSFLI